MKRPILFAIAALLLLVACDSTSTSDFDDLLVIEAFLYAGEPVDDIHITTAILLSSDDSVATPINTADVRLLRDDVVYALTPTGTDGYYHYTGDDLTIETGDRFRLEVAYEGVFVTAETIVPAPPTGISLSDEFLVVPELGTGGFGGFRGGNALDNTLTLEWDNPNEDLYFVVIESRITGDPDFILPEFFRERFGGFRLVTEPTTTNFHDIRMFSLEVTGLHEAILYRINQEYANLYENREQDSRDLNEPPTNMQGGLGVFSAFNSQRELFEVVREE